MSTVEREPRVSTPPLVAGQRLDQAAFHERYEAMPPGVRAELIGGVVHMPSPVGPIHGASSADVIAWLSHYRRRTPGVQVLDNASTVLDEQGEMQPDAILRILPEFGGRSGTDSRYIVGAPELIVEIARSSRYIDLGPKRADYERAGVPEYLVRAMDPDEVIWHRLRDGSLEIVPPDPDGLYRSTTFPGLWLDPKALLSGDLDGLITTLDRGLASPDHAAFVARLAAKRRPG